MPARIFSIYREPVLLLISPGMGAIIETSRGGLFGRSEPQSGLLQ